MLANLAGMEALVDVDENDIVQRRPRRQGRDRGRRAAGREFKGEVTEIANSAKIAGAGHDRPEDRVRGQGRDHRPGTAAAARHDRERRHRHRDPRERAQRADPERRGAHPGRSSARRKDARPTPRTRRRAALHARQDGFVEVVFVVEDGVADARQVKTGIQSDDPHRDRSRARGGGAGGRRQLPRDQPRPQGRRQVDGRLGREERRDRDRRSPGARAPRPRQDLRHEGHPGAGAARRLARRRATTSTSPSWARRARASRP